MPNVMAVLPYIGVQRRKLWLTPTARVPCSNAAKTRNPLKFAGVPQTNETISAANGPKFTILWGMWGRYCCLTSFFRMSIHVLVAKTKLWNGAQMATFWRFFACCIPASRAQHVSDLHSKFTLKPHHVWKYGRHPISDR